VVLLTWLGVLLNRGNLKPDSKFSEEYTSLGIKYLKQYTDDTHFKHLIYFTGDLVQEKGYFEHVSYAFLWTKNRCNNQSSVNVARLNKSGVPTKKISVAPSFLERMINPKKDKASKVMECENKFSKEPKITGEDVFSLSCWF